MTGNHGPANNPLHPSILHVLRQMVEVAERFNKPLSICGEMASDPGCFALLVGLGLREFSVSAPAILRLKAELDELVIGDLSELAERALLQDHAEGVRSLLKQNLQNVV
jgi:phosphoenolpyruvate-protein kinase (PTS system EI component)